MSIEEDGYKKVQLGPKFINIPTQWNLARLDNLTERLTNGISEKQDSEKSGLPVTRIETIADGSINYDKVGYIESEREEFSSYKLQKGDILFSHINSIPHIGKTAQYQGEKELYHGMNLLLIRFSNEKITDKYAYYFLNSKFARDFWVSNCKQAVNQASLNQKEVGSLSIILPPHPEQKKIAEVLSTVDEAIQKTEEIIERTKELKDGLIQDLFTRGLSQNGELRQDPEFLPGEYRETYLGLIPKKWNNYLIKDLAEVEYGLNSALDKTLNQGTKILSVSNLDKKGNLHLDEINYTDKEKIDKEDILQKGDILFNWRNGSKEHLGKTAYFDLKDEYTHVGLLLRIRVTKDLNVLPKFLFYFLSYVKYRKHFTRAKKQVNNSFNKTELKNLLVMIPENLEEQRKIAEILSSVDEKIKKEKSYKKNLEELKRGLMQDLITGKVRVTKLLS